MSFRKPECLKNGIFAKSTLKPISSVFNYDKEKQKIKMLSSVGEWISVSGLRRTGKTTLVRSTVTSMKKNTVLYVDMWGTEEKHEFNIFLERLRIEVKRLAEKNKLNKILSMLEGISFIGIKVDLRLKGEFILIDALESLSKKSSVTLIIDEAQIALGSEKVAEFLASIHDRFAPNFSTIMVGSVVSMRKIINSKNVMPLYGRMSDEIVLHPLSNEKARLFLVKGFEECGVAVDDTVIDVGVNAFGGFAGWLNWYGRRIVLEKLSKGDINPYRIVEIVEKEAQEQIYDEIARLLSDRKNIRLYLKIIKETAVEGFIGISDLAKVIKKDPSTVIFYLKHLISVGIVKKENQYYSIADPMIRRLAKHKDFEKEVKIRL